MVALGVVLLYWAGAAFGQIPVLTPGSVSRLEDLKGKIVMTRGFFSGPVLRYNSTGTILEGGSPESWTLAALRLDEVSRHEDVLELHGVRMALLSSGFTPVERQLRQGKKLKPDKVTIIGMLPRPNDAAAIELAQRIFVTDKEQLNESVPEYWRTFLGRFSSLPGTPANTTPGYPSATPMPGEQRTTAARVFRVGTGVSAPRLISSPDPVYTEAARTAQIQGTCVLLVVIGTDGSVRNVQIARPVGFGLDDNAVAAVKQWLFKPSIKDGEPVPVQVSIEVNFRLYN